MTDTGEHDPDEVVIRAGRVLVLNRMPVVHNGRSIGSVTTLRDRTELAKVESELGAFRGTTDLLRAQAHEFGNQLHTISGLIEIGDYDEVVTFVDTLVEKRASLDLTIARRVQDRSVAALLLAKAALAAEKKVTLRVSDRTGLSPLKSDSSFDVATVLGNLIDNGIDAVVTEGKQDPWVGVEIRQSDTSVELVVTDSGPGIDAELATEVFEHGYTTKAAQGGERGIGLALTLLICKRRGGEVVAQNTPDGAEFVARMTVTPGGRDARSQCRKGSGMISVVVIDDDFRVAKIHSSFVARIDGYEVVGVAHSGADALKLVKDVEPDLMLLDLYLPDIFGLDLLNQMRVQGLLCDVIVISAGNESKTVQQAVQLGVTNYLLKPFTFADLQQRLDDYRLNRASIHPYRLGDQSEIDRLFGRPGTSRLEQLPKGMSPETATLILTEVANSAGGISALECAEMGRHIAGQRSPLPRALHD